MLLPLPLMGLGYFAADPRTSSFETFQASLLGNSSAHALSPTRTDGSAPARLAPEVRPLFRQAAKGPRADRYREIQTTSYVERAPRIVLASLTGISPGITGALPAAARVTAPESPDVQVARARKGELLRTPATFGHTKAALFLTSLRSTLHAALESLDSPRHPPPRLPESLSHQGETQAEYMARQRRCLATAIYFEARGEPVQGQKAVAQVIMNRVRSPDYPDTICGVVYQGSHLPTGCQFSFTCDRRPETPRDMERWALANEIARKVTNGEVWLENIGHSTHFHATYVSPRWVRDMTRMQRIGQHVFYRIRNERPYEVDEIVPAAAPSPVPSAPSPASPERGLAFSPSG